MGFANPATDSGMAFRVLLDCMARPGRIGRLASLPPQESLVDSTWTLINTLVDAKAPLYLDPNLRSATLAQSIAFATGAKVVESVESAAFVIATPQHAEAMLADLPMGTPEYPDRSATLVIQCAELSKTPALTLTGPGIERKERFAAEGVSSEFWRALALRNRHNYPLGTDVFITASSLVAAIARSTRIEVA